jgi:hypothetical protein
VVEGARAANAGSMGARQISLNAVTVAQTKVCATKTKTARELLAPPWFETF